MWNSPESLFGPDTPQENLLFVEPAGKPVANRQENSLFVEQAGKPVAKPQENSLFVEEAGKPVAEGRGGHPTRKFTQDVNSKVRSPF